VHSHTLTHTGSMVDATTRKEGGQLYRIYLTAALQKKVLTPDEAADLKTLARLMGQGAVEVSKAYTDATGPLLKQALEDSVADEQYSSAAKQANKELVAGLQIPEAVVTEQLKDLYFQVIISCVTVAFVTVAFVTLEFC
jgi:hypothetical protein